MAVLLRGASAQDYQDPQEAPERGKPFGEGPHSAVEVPPGMELINVGGIRMIVEKGAKVEKKGSLLVMEGADEFAARNFDEIREHLEKMETGQADLRKTVEGLKRDIADLRKK